MRRCSPHRSRCNPCGPCVQTCGTAAPHFAPYRPPVKHSPFARPRIFTAAPPLVAAPRPPAARLAPRSHLRPLRRPSARESRKARCGAHGCYVKRGDSLWKLASNTLDTGLAGMNWSSSILAFSTRIKSWLARRLFCGCDFVGSNRHQVSPCGQATHSPKLHNPNLACSYAACIATANPAIRDANLIYAGQVLVLPPTASSSILLAPSHRVASVSLKALQDSVSHFLFLA